MWLHFGKYPIDVLVHLELISVSSVYVCSMQLIGTRRDPIKGMDIVTVKGKTSVFFDESLYRKKTSSTCKQNELLQSFSGL